MPSGRAEKPRRPAGAPAGTAGARDSAAHAEELDLEQKYVTMLYGRLDDLRERASGRLARTLRESGGTPAARTERDASAGMFSARIAQLDAAENGLCFGRLDFADDERRYIGRMGIRDESADYEPLLLDWRAPAARPFYLATAASPEGVTRRRHIKTRRRQVVGLDDEVLDLSAPQGAQHQGLTGEAALLAAVGASRTGRMADIVETIQAEQDTIIRSPQQGVLVVQGGPGTGEDRRRAAPGRLPAVHAPPAAGEARRAHRRAERDVPALHRAGAARTRRDRGGAVHAERAVSRGHPAARGRARRIGHQGQAGHGEGGGGRGQGQAAGTAPGDRNPVPG